jgi:hypothetical protein
MWYNKPPSYKATPSAMKGVLITGLTCHGRDNLIAFCYLSASDGGVFIIWHILITYTHIYKYIIFTGLENDFLLQMMNE